MSDVTTIAGSGLSGDTLYSSMNTVGDKTAEITNFTGVEFIYALSDQVSESIIEVMQDFFNAYPLGKTFQNRLKEVGKEVVVLDEFSPDTVNIPQIVVSGMPADNIPLGFGNKLGEIDYNGHHYVRIGGDANFNSTVSVYEGSMQSCKKLVDVVFLGFMFYIKMRLQSQQIWPEDTKLRFTNPTKVSSAGGNIGRVGGEVYSSKITFNIRTHWDQFFEVSGPDLEGLVFQGSSEDSDHEFETKEQ